MGQLRMHFRPEFLNRLDEVIMFKPLTKENIGDIIGLIMADLNGRLKDKSISVVLDEAAKKFVVERAFDPMYGARPLKRFVQTHVETLVAKKILADEVKEGDEIVITVVADRLEACLK